MSDNTGNGPPRIEQGYSWLRDRVGAALSKVLALQVAATSENGRR
jgi:hypothetical protein